MAAELGSQLGSIESRLAELEEQRLFSGEHDAGDAVVTVRSGAGGTDSQDWAEMLLRMYLRWAESRGFAVEIKEASEGEEAGLKSATFLVRGENAYGLFAAERGVHRLVRISPFDSQSRRHTAFAQRRGLAAGRRRHRGRARRGRHPRRHLPGLGSGRSARQQDRLGGAAHPPADRDRRPVPERALADPEQGDRDADAPGPAARARRSASAPRRWRWSAASRRSVEWGSQIRSYTLHPTTRVKDHRTGHEVGDAQRVLDGDLDGFVREYLLQTAASDQAPA